MMIDLEKPLGSLSWVLGLIPYTCSSLSSSKFACLDKYDSNWAKNHTKIFWNSKFENERNMLIAFFLTFLN